jgi:molybdopterin converting factor small subunit
MPITVLFFGPLAEISGIDRILVPDVSDTTALTGYLLGTYPLLGSQSWKLAVNQELCPANRDLHDGDIVALLSPFAGG